jgi:cytidylate kinase
MKVIAISGKIGTGKDLLCEKIFAYLDSKKIKYAHLKFAAGVKEIVSILTGNDLEDQYSDEGKERMVKELGMSNGALQQVVGTVLREKLHSNIWIFPVLKFARDNPHTICVISDCRFRNEADAIKEQGGIIIRLNRKNRNIGKRDPNHISETDLDDYPHFDLIIDNEGTVDAMVEKAFAFLKY